VAKLWKVQAGQLFGGLTAEFFLLQYMYKTPDRGQRPSKEGRKIKQAVKVNL